MGPVELSLSSAEQPRSGLRRTVVAVEQLDGARRYLRAALVQSSSAARFRAANEATAAKSKTQRPADSVCAQLMKLDVWEAGRSSITRTVR